MMKDALSHTDTFVRRYIDWQKAEVLAILKETLFQTQGWYRLKNKTPAALKANRLL